MRAALELANAANAVRPIARKGYITIPLFLLGWPTSELAPWLLGASALDAGRRARLGAFRGKSGVTALMLTAISWVLLATIHRRNLRSAPCFEEPLREALGADYTEALPLGKLTLAAGLLRSGSARRRYVGKADTIAYGPHRANRLDIWRRRGLKADAKAPVLVNVPGGAWVIGMRRPQAYPLMGRLAAEGWICVSVGYRVSPRHTWPDHIVDVKRALAWVRENIADYGGDPDWIAISGGSAGGHLAALCALTPNDPAWQPGFTDADTSVVAAAPLYGRYDWVSHRGTGAHRARPGVPAADGRQEGLRRATAMSTSRRRRFTASMPMRRRSSYCTGATTRSSRSVRPATSSPPCARYPSPPSRMPKFPAPSTLSRCSGHHTASTVPQR